MNLQAIRVATLALALFVPAPSLAQWTAKAPLPAERFYPVAIADGAQILVTGGSSTWLTEDVTPDSWIYDPHTDSWTEFAPLPTPRMLAVGVLFAGEYYVIGGWAHPSVGSSSRHVESWDPITDTWTEHPILQGPVTIDAELSVAVADEESIILVYEIGGVFRYYPGSAEVVQIGTFPPRPLRLGIAGAMLDGQIYVAGGSATDGNGDALLGVRAFDLATATWSDGAPNRIGRLYAGMVPLHGRLHLLAGASNFYTYDALDAVESYWPDLDAWVIGPTLPQTRWGAATAGVADQLFVIGGASTPTDLTMSPEVHDDVFALEMSAHENVCLCHYPPGNSNKANEICVDSKAAEVHLTKHGDTLGACP
jgi:N-acetylneuraminic acid mutarotase